MWEQMLIGTGGEVVAVKAAIIQPVIDTATVHHAH